MADNAGHAFTWPEWLTQYATSTLAGQYGKVAMLDKCWQHIVELTGQEET